MERADIEPVSPAHADGELQLGPADPPLVRWDPPDDRRTRLPEPVRPARPVRRLRAFLNALSLGVLGTLITLATGWFELHGEVPALLLFLPLAAVIAAAALWGFTGWFGALVGVIAVCVAGVLVRPIHDVYDFNETVLVETILAVPLAIVIGAVVAAVRFVRGQSANEVVALPWMTESIAGAEQRSRGRAAQPLTPAESDGQPGLPGGSPSRVVIPGWDPPAGRTSTKPSWRHGPTVLLGSLALIVLIASVAGIASRSGSTPTATGTLLPSQPAQIEATLSVGHGPRGITVAPNGVWVANWNDQTLWRIDPTTDAHLQSVPVWMQGSNIGPEVIAYGEGSLWVGVTHETESYAELPGSLIRLDPQYGRIEARIPIGLGAKDIAVSPGAVWVTQFQDNSVIRVDTASNTVTTTIPFKEPIGLAWADGSIWVSGTEGDLSRIDPATGHVLAALSTPDSGGYIAVDGTTLWVTNGGRIGSDGGVTRVDTTTNKVTASTELGFFPEHIAIGGGDAWITSSDNPTVFKVDTATGAAVPLSLDDTNFGAWNVATTAGAAWVVRSNDYAHPIPGNMTLVPFPD